MEHGCVALLIWRQMLRFSSKGRSRRCNGAQCFVVHTIREWGESGRHQDRLSLGEKRERGR